MRVSIIIATYNRVSLLRRTLPLVFAQDFPSDQFEIIVVDDGSTDATAEYLASCRPSCGFRYISQPNAGQAAAINTGIQAASGDILLFLDDDIECTPALVRSHVVKHEGASNNLVFGPVLLAPNQPPSLASVWVRTYCDDFFHDLEKHPEAAQYGWYFAFGNANSSGRREFITASGGLLPELIRSNDLEFGFRLYRAGGKFVYAEEAVAYQRWVKPLRSITIDEPRSEGIAEVMICDAIPEYRRHSRLVSIMGGPWWKRLLRRAVVTAPIDLSPAMSLLAAAFGKFRSVPRFREIAFALLRTAMGTAFFRSAVRFLGGWQQFRQRFAMQLPVLLYHRVGPKLDGEFHALSISASEFRRQMIWLRNNGYESIFPEDWSAWVQRGTPLPSKPIIITFDDAYADMEEHAFPVMEKCGFRATVYVVTSEIGGTNRWDQANGYRRMSLMSAAQIEHWSERGFRFASHTSTHPDLTKLSEPCIQQELSASKNNLERLLEAPVNSFAYPYGFYDCRSADLAAATFETAFTCDEGLNHAGTPLHLLRRTSVEPFFSLVDPAARVWFGFNPLQLLRLYLGLLRRRLLRAQSASKPS